MTRRFRSLEWLAALAVIVVSGCGISDQAPQPGQTTGTPAPVVAPAESGGIEETAIEIAGGAFRDFGDLAKGETRTHIFRFMNKGQKPLEVERLHKSCGCVSAKLLSEKTIPPGAAASVEVRVEGSQAKKLTDSYLLRLMFAGNTYADARFTFHTIADVYIEPEKIDHGAVHAKDAIHGTVILSRDIALPLEIKACRFAKSSGEATFSNTEPSRVVIAYALSPQPVGAYSDTLEIETNSDIDAHIKIPLVWEIQPNVEVSPATIFWGLVDANSRQVRTIALESLDAGGLEVLSVDYDKSFYSVEKAAPESENQNPNFLLTLDGSRLAGTSVCKSDIRFLTDKGEVVLSTFFTRITTRDTAAN